MTPRRTKWPSGDRCVRSIGVVRPIRQPPSRVGRTAAALNARSSDDSRDRWSAWLMPRWDVGTVHKGLVIRRTLCGEPGLRSWRWSRVTCPLCWRFPCSPSSSTPSVLKRHRRRALGRDNTDRTRSEAAPLAWRLPVPPSSGKDQQTPCPNRGGDRQPATFGRAVTTPTGEQAVDDLADP